MKFDYALLEQMRQERDASAVAAHFALHADEILLGIAGVLDRVQHGWACTIGNRCLCGLDEVRADLLKALGPGANLFVVIR